MKGFNLLTGLVNIFKHGIILSKPQFEQIWAIANATTTDTIVFMQATGKIKMPRRIMEVVIGSPPFYVERLVLHTLSFINHHLLAYYKHTPLHNLPTLKSYSNTIFHQIREKPTHHFQVGIEDSHNQGHYHLLQMVQQYTWVQECQPHRLRSPYITQQIKKYVMKVIREKEIHT